MKEQFTVLQNGIFKEFMETGPVLEYDFLENLFEGLVDETENAIKSSVDNFLKQGPTPLMYVTNEDATDCEYTEVFGRVDGTYINLDWVYKEYYPGLMRRSTYLTIFGMIEHALTISCDRIIKRYHFPLTLKDIRNQGINAVITFITKVLNENQDLSTAKSIETLIALRNVCTHSDASFNTKHNNSQKIIALAEKKNKLFSLREPVYVFNDEDNTYKTYTITLLKGSLDYLLKEFRAFGTEITKIIEEYEKRQRKKTD